MTGYYDPERYQLFAELLSMPDPADLPHRGHAWTCEGRADRRKTVLQPLVVTWLQHRHLNADPYERHRRSA